MIAPAKRILSRFSRAERLILAASAAASIGLVVGVALASALIVSFFVAALLFGTVLLHLDGRRKARVATELLRKQKSRPEHERALQTKLDALSRQVASNPEAFHTLHAEMTAMQNSLAWLRRDIQKAQQGGQSDLYELMHDVQTETIRQTLAGVQLLGGLRPSAPLPSVGGWALDASALLRLLYLVRRTRPRLVVECGSGSSTVVLAYALSETGGRLVSLEHHPTYAAKTRELLEEHGLSHVAEVRLAELTEFLAPDGRSLRWYDPQQVADLSDIDLLIVDGPPHRTGPQPRYPAIPVLGARLRDGAYVLLDDAQRDEERRTIKRWLSESNLTPVHHEGATALYRYAPGAPDEGNGGGKPD